LLRPVFQIVASLLTFFAR